MNLERFLRDVESRGPLQAAQALMSRSDLWLGPIRPQFSGEILKAIRLLSWRSLRGEVRNPVSGYLDLLCFPTSVVSFLEASLA